jgi:hypothetical protein
MVETSGSMSQMSRGARMGSDPGRAADVYAVVMLADGKPVDEPVGIVDWSIATVRAFIDLATWGAIPVEPLSDVVVLRSDTGELVLHHGFGINASAAQADYESLSGALARMSPEEFRAAHLTDHTLSPD